MFYNRKECSKTGNRCSKTGNLVIFLFWNVLYLFFVSFRESDFVPGRPETEVFVSGHLLLPLYRDKGTPGQEFFFVPGQRDNGTSRPVETLVCMYLNFNGFIE